MLTLAEVQANMSDSQLSSAISSGNDVLAAARLSELLTQVNMIPISTLAVWAAQTGIRASLQDASNTIEHPLRSVALTAIDLLRGNMAENFDTVAYSGLLDALQAGGIMTQAHRDALMAIATGPKLVTPDEVAKVTRNEDGSSKL